MFFIAKIIVSAVVIAIVSEIAKKYTSIGGLVAAMPLTTMLALCWLYYEKKDLQLLADFAKSVFLGFPISLLFFIPVIYLFRKGYNFYFVMFAGIIFIGIGAFIQQRLVR